MTNVAQSDGVASADSRLRNIVDHLDRDEPARALELLNPLVSVAKPSIAARFVLAMTAWQLQRFDWALTILKACHDDAPDNGGVAEVLASLQAQLGQLDESLFTGKLATALGNDCALAALVPKAYPGFDRAFLSIVERPLLGKAREALAQGKLSGAIEFARQHVAIDPIHVDGRAFYAGCLMRSGAAAAAAETLKPLMDGACAPSPEIASLYARALTAVGERKYAAHWHQDAVTTAPGNPVLAAARIADAPFLGLESSEVARASRDWLARFSLAPRPARKHGAGRKLVVGYLVSAFIDADDAVAVAAVAQAHDRTRVNVLAFGLGSQTAEQNVRLIGAFSKWRDISALDPATLARTLSGDGVDVLIDAGGFASAFQLQALTRFETGLRVSWLGNPAAILAPLYDVRLAAADYPVLGDAVQTAAKAGEMPVAFGADVTLAQLDSRTVALWSAVLALVPEAKLVLRARDMDSSANIARLVGAFGETLAARIDLRHAECAGEFYEAVDVALLPYRAISPRAAAEALGHGVPAIAMAGEPFGAFMSGHGLERFIAADGAQYCSLAMALAASPPTRVLPPIERGATKLARAIEELGYDMSRRESAA